MINETPIYFKGLNGLRAIAAMMVVVSHVDQFAESFHINTTGFHSTGMGSYAVDLFFVLSGFLITYLLLLEKERTQKIDLKKFYLRRIFRIWPLYYVALLIAVVMVYYNIVPTPENYSMSISLYLFLMANVAYAADVAIRCITPLWSVGVEEQFYLVWPYVIKKVSNYIRGIAFYYFIFVVLKLLIYVIFTPDSKLYMLLSLTRLNIMCMGALGAYLAYSKHPLLKIVYRVELQIISWAVLVISGVYKPLHVFSFIDPDLNAVFYLIIVLNISTNGKSLVSLENKIMNFLGQISYGIYVYHMIIIFLFLQMIQFFDFKLNLLCTYSCVILSTISMAALSYYYLEMPFLKIKKRFAMVASTNSVSEGEQTSAT